MTVEPLGSLIHTVFGMCLELLVREGYSVEEIMDKCYQRFEKKLVNKFIYATVISLAASLYVLCVATIAVLVREAGWKRTA